MSLTTVPLCDKLKASRESRGLSLDEVAHVTRIPVSRLMQMEEGNLAAFGSMTYARGFLRNYSRFLGIDGEAREFIGTLPPPVFGGAADYRHLTRSYGRWVDKNAPKLPSREKAHSMVSTALMMTAMMGLGLVLYASLFIAPALAKASRQPVAEITTPTVSPEIRPVQQTVFVDSAHPRVPYRRATLVEDFAGSKPIPQ